MTKMTLPQRVTLGLKLLVAMGLTGALSACWYNYADNSDQIYYGAGNAVRANLEASTTDPSSDEQYDLSDLGEDGDQQPKEEEDTP